MAKEFIALKSNHLYYERADDAIGAMEELIVIVSEPKYTFDPAGSMTTHREVTDFRFYAVASQLRKIAEAFAKIADDAEEYEQRAKAMTKPADEGKQP